MSTQNPSLSFSTQTARCRDGPIAQQGCTDDIDLVTPREMCQVSTRACRETAVTNSLVVLMAERNKARRVLTVQSSPSAGGLYSSHQAASRVTRLTLGVAVVVLLLLLAVIGASAERGLGASQLRRGPASAVLSVLFTIAGLAGIGSLALLFWGLVTKNRRGLDSSEPRRHSPILVAGAALAVFACLAALLALAARGRHIQSLPALSGRPSVHTGTATAPLPFNAFASFTTSGIVVGAVVLVVMVKLVRSMGWRRVLRRLPVPPSGTDAAVDGEEALRPESEELGVQLALVKVADPSSEPDPRRAVIACYGQMLEIAARHGPERRRSETPAEYLRRILAITAAAATPATLLTGLFEQARYSERPVGESMRSDAITALDAIRNEILAGVMS